MGFPSLYAGLLPLFVCGCLCVCVCVCVYVIRFVSTLLDENREVQLGVDVKEARLSARGFGYLGAFPLPWLGLSLASEQGCLIWLTYVPVCEHMVTDHWG